MRSYTAPLFVPGNRPDRYAKAAVSGADAIIIDLEDAVAPEAKAATRVVLAEHDVLHGDVAVIVRLNGSRSPWYEEDVVSVQSLHVATVMLPKVEDADEVRRLAATLPGRAIIAQIETAKGLAAVREIGRSCDRLQLAFGSIDFSLDLGCAHTREALLAARSELVLASALSGLSRPLDGVTAVLEEEETVESDARYAAMLGFSGKLCVHPKQIAATMRAFRPSDHEVSWARQVLAADQGGAVAVEGMMVDYPVRQQARKILARAADAVRNHRT